MSDTGREASAAFDLLIFDCDGVLVDSEVLACRAVSEALAEFGLSLPVDEVAERFLGRSSKDMYAALANDWGCVLSDEVRGRIRARSRELFERELRPVLGIAAVLDALAGPRCVASSSGPEAIAYKLGRTDLLHRFDPATYLLMQNRERHGAIVQNCIVKGADIEAHT